MPWTISWDNGFDARGIWGHLIFDTEEEAQSYADSVMEEYIAEGIWDKEGSAEPYWLEPAPTPFTEEECWQTVLMLVAQVEQGRSIESALLRIQHTIHNLRSFAND